MYNVVLDVSCASGHMLDFKYLTGGSAAGNHLDTVCMNTVPQRRDYSVFPFKGDIII